MTSKLRAPRPPSPEVLALMEVIFVPDGMFPVLHQMIISQLFCAGPEYVHQYERHLEALERVAAARGIDLLGNPG